MEQCQKKRMLLRDHLVKEFLYCERWQSRGAVLPIYSFSLAFFSIIFTFK